MKIGLLLTFIALITPLMSANAQSFHISSGAFILDGSSANATVVGGSVTASSFFGDGSNLTGIAVATYTAHIPQFTTSQTAFINCVTGSTITMTTRGGGVEVGFSGSLVQNGPSLGLVSFLQDGGYISPLSSALSVTASAGSNASADSRNLSFVYYIPPSQVAAGTHSWCLSIRIDNGAYAVTLHSDTYYFSNQFWVREITQ